MYPTWMVLSPLQSALTHRDVFTVEVPKRKCSKGQYEREYCQLKCKHLERINVFWVNYWLIYSDKSSEGLRSQCMKCHFISHQSSTKMYYVYWIPLFKMWYLWSNYEQNIHEKGMLQILISFINVLRRPTIVIEQIG